MKIFYILSLLFSVQIGWAQGNPYSQEKAELAALQKYELEHPPQDSIVMPTPAENEILFGARLTRSATLLATSCRERRLPVKILIYGQSITGSRMFSEEVGAYLKDKFPYADITLENRSIGGFGGEQLIRTAVHDVYPVYPDLIIFHVYGGEKHGELEQLFSNIRKLTTADVLLMNHHVNGSQKEVSETSYKYLQYIANKYNLELVDISTAWVKYLADNHLKPTDLLRDNVHPNKNGNRLMAQLIGRHIRSNTLFPTQYPGMVQSCFATSAYDKNGTNQLIFKGNPWDIVNGVPVGASEKSSLKLTFYGNKVELIAGQVPGPATSGSARIKIDGKPITAKSMVYAITRPTPGPKTWFPSVRRISYQSPLIAEDWTMEIDKVNADSTIWYFTVTGSKTGKDGSGNSGASFVSKSGRVVIDQSDYVFTSIKKTFKISAPVGFKVLWSVVPLFDGIYHTPVIADKTKIYKTTLVQGLTNGPHTLELIPVGDGPVPVESFEIHRPPLQ